MGLMKSSMGIGALLLDGIGDTIRVSLTDDPVEEVYAAKDILKAAGLRKEGVNIISCPTCGRTQIDLIGLVNQVDAALKNCEKPILIMQGDKDFQCKAEIDFALYKNLLKDKENVTFHIYENLNHCFVPSVYGVISKAQQEYNREQHIGENVITDIANWIKEA